MCHNLNKTHNCVYKLGWTRLSSLKYIRFLLIPICPFKSFNSNIKLNLPSLSYKLFNNVTNLSKGLDEKYLSINELRLQENLSLQKYCFLICKLRFDPLFSLIK